MRGIDLLGKTVLDKVTRFSGVVTSISYDLYGCVQAIVMPGLDEKDEPRDGRWFDIHRLLVTDDTRVMPVPDFGDVIGPAEKSLPPSGPR